MWVLLLVVVSGNQRGGVEMTLDEDVLSFSNGVCQYVACLLFLTDVEVPMVYS